MLPGALEYPPGVVSRVYRPARGGRSCERFGGYKTINRIPLPLGMSTKVYDLMYTDINNVDKVEMITRVISPHRGDRAFRYTALQLTPDIPEQHLSVYWLIGISSPRVSYGVKLSPFSR